MFYLKKYIFLIFTVLIYSFIATKWIKFLPSWEIFIFEIPIILLLSFAFDFYYNDHKNKVPLMRYLMPPIACIILYAFYDKFYLSWLRVPYFSDLSNMFSLVGVWGFWGFLLLLSPAILYFMMLFFQIKRYYLAHTKNEFWSNMFNKILAILLAIAFLFTPLFSIISERFLKFDDHKSGENMQRRGRITSMFYNRIKKENKKEALIEKMQQDLAQLGKAFEMPKSDCTQNVYVIMLESFFDVRKFFHLETDKNPIHKQLQKYLINNDFSYLQVPVFGAGTAQSEFEILTGTPALQLFHSIEFNALKGMPSYSLASIFRENNYLTEAIVATDSIFYNSQLAYKSLNFHNINFLNQPNSILQIPNANLDIFPTDSEIFSCLKDVYNPQKKPLFSYIVTMFGHRPYQRDLEKFPNVIKVDVSTKALEGNINEITDYVNTTYYKTKMIGEFLDKLFAKEPNSIVFLFSDHLPDISRKLLLENSEESPEYNKLHFYIAPALLLDGGRPISLTSQKLYEAHYELLQYLNFKNITIDPNILQLRYLEIINSSQK